MKRIDVIGVNGNDGTHYHVEKIARIMAGEKHNEVLRGKMTGKRRWELFVPRAIKVLDYIDNNYK